MDVAETDKGDEVAKALEAAQFQIEKLNGAVDIMREVLISEHQGRAAGHFRAQAAAERMAAENVKARADKNLEEVKNKEVELTKIEAAEKTVQDANDRLQKAEQAEVAANEARQTAVEKNRGALERVTTADAALFSMDEMAQSHQKMMDLTQAMRRDESKASAAARERSNKVATMELRVGGLVSGGAGVRMKGADEEESKEYIANGLLESDKDTASANRSMVTAQDAGFEYEEGDQEVQAMGQGDITEGSRSAQIDAIVDAVSAHEDESLINLANELIEKDVDPDVIAGAVNEAAKFNLIELGSPVEQQLGNPDGSMAMLQAIGGGSSSSSSSWQQAAGGGGSSSSSSSSSYSHINQDW